MRRKDREAPAEIGLEIVDKCVYATLGCANADGSPYCVPLSIAREGENVYFHCATQGKKLDNLRRDNRVCVSCVGNTAYPPGEFTVDFESAVIIGSASEVSDNDEKIRALKLLCERHTPDNMSNFDQAIKSSLKITGVWKIKIEEITAKKKGLRLRQ